MRVTIHPSNPQPKNHANAQPERVARVSVWPLITVSDIVKSPKVTIRIGAIYE